MTGPRDVGAADGSDEVEGRLRAAFADARLPAAPETLRASLERVPVGVPRATASARPWPAKAVPAMAAAAVVVALVALAGLAGGLPGPARTSAPTAGATPSATPASTPVESGSGLPSASGLAVIPWVNAPPPPEPGRPTPRPVAPGTRTCRPADLVATAGWQGATGTMAGGISVTNVSPTACVLDGPPALVVIRAGSRAMATEYHPSVGGGPAGTTPPGPGLLQPGDRGGWWLFWENWCGAALVPTSVLVTLPGGDGTIVAGPDPVDPGPGMAGTPRCDAPESPSTLSATAFEYIAPEPPLVEGQTARATISVPATATLGRDVTFTVTLTNLGSRPAALDPCPTYTEDLLIGGVRLKPPADRSYALNCAAVGGVIAPGATVVLEMRYPIPASVPLGPAELLWSMDPGGPFDTGAFGRVPITIVSAPTP